MKTMRTLILAAVTVITFAGADVTASAKTTFGTLKDIQAACSTSATVETKKGMTEVDTDSDVNPYDVIYAYGEKFDSYVDTCDWSLVFDAEYYAETFPMLALQYHNDADLLLMHFQTVGIHEGRQASEDFNVGAYIYNCDYSIYKVFKKNYASYYIYYMLNYVAEKDVNTVTADNGKTVKQQYDTVLTWYQAEELKRINQYREKAGSDPVEFDSELAAFASYRAYLNAHDGYKAHDWFIDNLKNNQNGAGAKAVRKMAVNGVVISENTVTSWGKTHNTDITAGRYRNSKEHYEAMVNSDNLYVGISNFTASPEYDTVNGNTTRTHSQFDVYLNWAINTVTHPAD